MICFAEKVWPICISWFQNLVQLKISALHATDITLLSCVQLFFQACIANIFSPFLLQGLSFWSSANEMHDQLD